MPFKTLGRPFLDDSVNIGEMSDVERTDFVLNCMRKLEKYVKGEFKKIEGNNQYQVMHDRASDNDYGELEEEIKTLKQRVSLLELPENSDSVLKDLNLLEGRIDNNRDRINKLEFKYRVTEHTGKKVPDDFGLPIVEHFFKIQTGDLLEINGVRFRLKSLGLLHPAYTLQEEK